MNTVRVKAEDIQPGDRVARARTHPFHEVVAVETFERAVRIRYAKGSGSGYGGSDRPRREALWWKEERPPYSREQYEQDKRARERRKVSD